MIDRMYLHLLCPECGKPVEEIRYSSRGTYVEYRIKCNTKSCKIDTGKQCTLADCFQALICLYYNGQSNRLYNVGDKNDKIYNV